MKTRKSIGLPQIGNCQIFASAHSVFLPFITCKLGKVNRVNTSGSGSVDNSTEINYVCKQP